MLARFGVRRYVTGRGLTYNPADYNLVVAWDAQCRGYRTICLDRLLSIRCGDIQWKAQ